METNEAGEKRLVVRLSDGQVGHVTTASGDPLLLLKFASPGARALRLHIRDMHLPAGATLFAYSVNEGGLVRKVSGPYAGSASFWTDPLPGDTAFIEVQWSDEIPGDLPFDISELAESELAGEQARVTEEDEQQREVGSGAYRGRDVTYHVSEGLAVFEGDIVLGTPENVSSPDRGKKDAIRNAVAITGTSFRWTGGVIPYVIASDLPSPSRATDAIAHWNSKLSGVIQFVPRTTQANYVYIVRGSGCSSYIGMVNIGAQKVWLADSCSTGSAIHELGHAVGLWHEQGRADRNSHVRILWENIKSGAEMNFGQNINDGDDIGLYDHVSIMHYGTYTFSSNGKPTIETIPAGIAIGQRTGLSTGDITAVRLLYGGTSTMSPPPPNSSSTVNVTFNTHPSALQVKVDGTVYTAPRSFNWTVGSTHTVEAIEPAASAGTKYKFARWSNQGGKVHIVTASSNVSSYTATYSLSHLVDASSVYPAGIGTASISPVSPDKYYPANSSVVVQATPAAGYCFNRWRDMVSGSPSTATLTVTRGYWLRAEFIPGSITLSPTARTISAAGASMTFAVSATSGCLWQAKTNVPWITIASGKTGTGPLTVTYSVAPNTSGARRTGTIVVEGKLHSITQY